MESKEEESKLDVSDAKLSPSEDLNDLHPLVSSFLEFSYGSELSDVADEWISRHYEEGGFAHKAAYEADGSGHPMNWSTLHTEYCEALDGKLQKFCKDNGTDARELFALLEEAMEMNEHVQDALPNFVKLTSYEHFCSQMESFATADDKKEEAQELASGGDDPWSGEWRGLYNFDSRKRDKHLQVRGRASEATASEESQGQSLLTY